MITRGLFFILIVIIAYIFSDGDNHPDGDAALV